MLRVGLAAEALDSACGSVCLAGCGCVFSLTVGIFVPADVLTRVCRRVCGLWGEQAPEWAVGSRVSEQVPSEC